MAFIYKNINSDILSTIMYGGNSLSGIAYQSSIIWRKEESIYSTISIHIDPNSIGKIVIEAVGEDVISQGMNTAGTHWVIKANLGGTCTLNYTPIEGYQIAQLRFDYNDITSPFTIDVLEEQHVGWVSVMEEVEAFVDFLERSDKLGTYYSTLDSAIRAVQADYPDKLTRDVSINCIHNNCVEKRDPGDTNKTPPDRLWVSSIKDWNQNSLYTLTINGNDNYTIHGKSLGILHIDKSDNIILKGIQFMDYSNYIGASSPEEFAAIYLTGNEEHTPKNLVIEGCRFYGRLNKDNSVWNSDYALDIKNAANILVSNSDFINAGCVTVKASNIKTLEIKGSKLSGTINRMRIPHESLFLVTNCKSLKVCDCDLNGEFLDEYGLVLTEVADITFKRTSVYNFNGTGIFVASSNPVNATIESCLFYAICNRYVYAYLKFFIEFSANLNTLNVLNNTFVCTSDKMLFQEFLKVTGDVGILKLCNNIFVDKSDKLNYCTNVGGNIANLESKNNLYKAKHWNDDVEERFYTMTILSCANLADLEVSDKRDLADFKKVGLETGSWNVLDSDKVLNVEDGGVDYAIKPALGVTYSGTDNPIEFDILYNRYDKTVMPKYTVGAYNNFASTWDETTDSTIGYEGTNTIDFNTFDYKNQYSVPSEEGLLIECITKDRTKLVKTTIVSSQDTRMFYGGVTYIEFECNKDENEMYISDRDYDIKIELL